MTAEELSGTIKRELEARSWSITDLSREAGVAYETARRATHALGHVGVHTANKLLVALDLELVTIRKEVPHEAARA